MSQFDLASLVRNIPDFPMPGIQFKDITTLLRNGEAFVQVIDQLVERYRNQDIDAIAGIESRGFIFSAPIAYKLGIGLVPIRKPGKLPSETYQIEYALEYGTNKLEIHRDALNPGDRVVVVDDLLATGGTISAACSLIEQAGGQVAELAFLIELGFLNGRSQLGDYSIFSLIQY
jgi:adenine phosphoribosyltransferase